jgi:hypothetical protein
MREHGCREVQGYYFSARRPLAELQEMMATGGRRGVISTDLARREAVDGAVAEHPDVELAGREDRCERFG